MKLNHIFVLTTDLKAMELFWTEVIGLHVGERPPFPFNGAWIYSDDQPLVHIAEQLNSAIGHGSIAHVALEGADYPVLLERLDNSLYRYSEKIVPLSNERQIFIHGPDGLTIEMLFPLDEDHKLLKNVAATTYQTNENLEFLGGKI
jgi:lactoylglutathione lyase